MGKKAIDGSDRGFYSQGHKKYVKEQMQIEGFSLEIKVYEMLKKRGWDAELGDHFWEIDRTLSQKERTVQFLADLQSSTLMNREMDVVTERSGIPIKVGIFNSARVKLVVECKTREGENWVIYMEERDISKTTISEFGYSVRNDISVRRYLQSFSDEQIKISEASRKKLQGTSHHRLDESLVIGIKGKSLFKNSKSFYNSLCQVIDATDFNYVAECSSSEIDIVSNRRAKIPRFGYWCIYPVIVIDGPLWKVSLKNPNPEPLEYAKFKIMKFNQEFLVDIVRWDCFGKYLDTLDNEIESLEKLV